MNRMKMAYMDLHTHILPDIDDGAKDQGEALQMIKAAYAQGVRCICATPHMNADTVRDQAYLEKIQKTFEQLRRDVLSVLPQMQLFLGNELLFFSGCSEYLKKRQICTLNQSRYVLTEFFPGETYKNVFRAMQELIGSGYIPVIAHMERLDCLWKQPGRIEALKNICVLLQMNTGSLNGSVFDSHVRCCRRLVKAGYIDLLGSDMHNMSGRPPSYSATAWIEKTCGSDILKKLACTNPLRILQNKIIE